MKPCIIALVAAAALLTGCSTGLSKQEVQSMIDKSIAAQQQQRPAAETPQAAAPVEPEPAAFTPAAEIDSPPDATVNSHLNNADLRFNDKEEKDGCWWVQLAITSAASSPVSEDQSRQLKDYASRCNLRY